jgi:hypothetical protein
MEKVKYEEKIFKNCYINILKNYFTQGVYLSKITADNEIKFYL